MCCPTVLKTLAARARRIWLSRKAAKGGKNEVSRRVQRQNVESTWNSTKPTPETHLSLPIRSQPQENLPYRLPLRVPNRTQPVPSKRSRQSSRNVPNDEPKSQSTSSSHDRPNPTVAFPPQLRLQQITEHIRERLVCVCVIPRG